MLFENIIYLSLLLSADNNSESVETFLIETTSDELFPAASTLSLLIFSSTTTAASGLVTLTSTFSNEPLPTCATTSGLAETTISLLVSTLTGFVDVGTAVISTAGIFPFSSITILP